MAPVDRSGVLALAVVAVAVCSWAGDGSGTPAPPGTTAAATLEGYQPEERALIERLRDADLTTRLAAAADRGTPECAGVCRRSPAMGHRAAGIAPPGRRALGLNRGEQNGYGIRANGSSEVIAG